MTWQTNSTLIQLRNLARKAGLTRILVHILPSRGYEAAFDSALFATIREGDTVWDVGANIGYYTKKFSQAVGLKGKVIAFEPFPAVADRLSATVSGLDNVIIKHTALGNRNGTTTMQAGLDKNNSTSRIVEEAEANAIEIEIEILTGDTALQADHVDSPTVIKIDTEGFELDVLKGMNSLLQNPNLRAVFVEVHFSLLAERGIPMAPIEIEELLGSKGFSTNWVDPSHIAGTRG